MCDAFAKLYSAWLAALHPDLAEAYAELHRFVHILVPPGVKTPAEARLAAEFDALVLRLPWLLGQRKHESNFAEMAAALRGAFALGARWVPPDAAFGGAQCAQSKCDASDCDACRHFLCAAARLLE